VAPKSKPYTEVYLTRITTCELDYIFIKLNYQMSSKLIISSFDIKYSMRDLVGDVNY